MLVGAIQNPNMNLEFHSTIKNLLLDCVLYFWYIPQVTTIIRLIIIEVRSWLYSAKIFAELELRVWSSFLLYASPNTSPSPHLQKELSCMHPCHTWNLRLGNPCEVVSPNFHALNGWDCTDWPQVTWDLGLGSPCEPAYECAYHESGRHQNGNEICEGNQLEVSWSHLRSSSLTALRSRDTSCASIARGSKSVTKKWNVEEPRFSSSFESITPAPRIMVISITQKIRQTIACILVMF